MKTIPNGTYMMMIQVIAAMAVIIIIGGMYLSKTLYDNTVLESDLKHTIAKHNKLNHEVKECNDKIIQGTCLTRNPSWEEVSGS